MVRLLSAKSVFILALVGVLLLGLLGLLGLLLRRLPVELLRRLGRGGRLLLSTSTSSGLRALLTSVFHMLLFFAGLSKFFALLGYHMTYTIFSSSGQRRIHPSGTGDSCSSTLVLCISSCSCPCCAGGSWRCSCCSLCSWRCFCHSFWLCCSSGALSPAQRKSFAWGLGMKPSNQTADIIIK